ncbi:MAG: hypothetical protein ACREUY_04335 [Burkholderiales bacterium]
MPTCEERVTVLPLDIVPFEPWHLEWLTATTEQAWLARTPAYGASLKAAGPCFSAFAGMRVIACAGVTPCWAGRAKAWSMVSDDLGRYVMGVHRAVKRFLDSYPARRIECDVDPRSDVAVRWAVRLGFEYEGTQRAYTPSGDDMDLYARIRR